MELALMTIKMLPEVHAIRHIHQIHNEPGTISGGYNTLGFDDEFLRFYFMKLITPVLTSVQ